YGLPFVSPNNLLVSTIDFTGAAIESVYMAIFIVFAPKKVRMKTLIHLAAVVIVFIGFALVSQFVISQHYRQLFCGLTTTILSICIVCFTSSSHETGDGNKERGFHAILLIVGYVPMWNILVPNGVRCGLGALQLILYAIYRNNKGVGNGTKATTTAPTPFDDDTWRKDLAKRKRLVQFSISLQLHT
ncbi:hypothetical protein GIB67_031900, partial [Kingdonia uniflora]